MILKQGIDVSHHQGKIDWKKVKESGKVDFAMIRAGYYSTLDDQFLANVYGCVKNEIDFGVYWYSYSYGVKEAGIEANACWNAIKNLSFSYPVAFDFEEYAQLNLPLDKQIKIIDTFMKFIESKRFFAVLYMPAFYMQRLLDYEANWLAQYDRWVAHINVSRPAFDGAYGMHQYSWEGRIPGIDTLVDLDTCYRDYPGIITNAKLNNIRSVF